MQCQCFFWLTVLLAIAFGESVQAQITFDGTSLLDAVYEANYPGDLPEAVCSTASGDDDRIFLADPRNIEDEAPTYLDKKTGLIGLAASKRHLTAAVYDGIVRGPGHTFLAARRGCVGLLARDGKVLIPFSNNSLSVSEFAETGNPRSKSTVLEALRPEGRYLFKIDLVGDRLVKSEGPFVSVVNVEVPRHSGEAQQYAAVSDKYEGHVGLLDQDLNYVLPVKYERIRQLQFADGKKYWVGATDRVQIPPKGPNERIDDLWSVHFFDAKGTPIRTMRVYALRGLEWLGVQYGFVGLQEDHTCAYVDSSLDTFEIGKSFKDKCVTGDQHYRVFITRPNNPESAIWTLGPAQETSNDTLPAWKQDKLNMAAFAEGLFVWRKTYEGNFSQADLNYNDEFVLLRRADGKAFKLVDRFGRDTGETYESGELICNEIFVHKGNHTFRTQGWDMTTNGSVVAADDEQLGYCLRL
ncbi:hypothetical protein DIE23_32800 [Burkholderia sp. Bp9143]|nr:hypothetical protein DIE23_32800 [Burkholderia sp. Bp9143]